MKKQLNTLLHYDGEDLLGFFREEYPEEIIPQVLVELFEQIKSPYRCLQRISKLVDIVVAEYEQKLLDSDQLDTGCASYMQTPSAFEKIFYQKADEIQRSNSERLHDRDDSLLEDMEEDRAIWVDQKKRFSLQRRKTQDPSGASAFERSNTNIPTRMS